MTVKEQALQQAIEIAVSHYDCFYEHGGGKLDVLSISNIQLFDCKLYPSDGMDGSNLEKCTGAAVFLYAYQSRTCTGTVGRSRNRMRRTTMMVLDVALG